MDVAKQKVPARAKLPKWLMIAAPVLLLLLAYLAFSGEKNRQIARDRLIIAKVNQGNLQVRVDGYGVLRSHKQKLMTSLPPATVEEIVLRPGARVEPDSIIIQMNNPELHEEVERVRMQLNQERSNLRKLELDNQRDLLAEQDRLAEMNAKYNMVKLRREAEQELLEKGVVSQLTFKTTVLEQEQLQNSINIQNNRIAQLTLVNQEAVKIQQEQVRQMEALFQTVSNRVDALTVRAGARGVLQRLPVELGQSVRARNWRLSAANRICWP